MVRIRLMMFTAAAALALLLPAAAGAQPEPPEGEPEEMPPPPDMPELEDPHPLAVLHAANQIQSQLALMGINEAEDDDVRELAEGIAERHGELDREMLAIANDLDVDVAGTGAVRLAMEMQLQDYEPGLQALMEAPREAFDGAFLELVTESHEGAIEVATEARADVEEERVRNLIDDALNAYRSHLEEAEELQETIEE